MALLILLSNTLCLMNMLALVWLLWKPLCGYYRRGFYCMMVIDKSRYMSQIKCTPFILQIQVCSYTALKTINLK